MLLLTTILIIGASGLVAQVMLLRELVVSFYGNELTVGIVLANWLVCEALGVYLVGRVIDRIRQKMALFLSLELLFLVFLPLCVYFARAYKSLLGIPPGEGVGLQLIFFASLAILFPVSFTHGGLFSAACCLYKQLKSRAQEGGIGTVYAVETIGTIIGGIVLTYLFLPLLGSFQIAAAVIITNSVACVFLLRRFSSRRAAYLLLALLLALSVCLRLGCLERAEQLSIRKQLPHGQVVGYRNSVYGNIAVTRQAGQYTFFSNGLPVITTPVPDLTFTEEFGNIPLAFHPRPRKILVAGAGAGGLLAQILKHPVAAVDYLELDPLLITMVRRFSTPLTAAELEDKRVSVKNVDARYYLRTTAGRYDVILIGISNPSDLAANRLFTSEFFALVKKHLNPDGIIAFWLPGSLSYLSEQMQSLNESILASLEASFGSVRIIPGDYVIYLASASSAIQTVGPEQLTDRLAGRGVETALLSEEYLAYRLSPEYLRWFTQTVRAQSARQNRDLRPEAVFQMLLLWNKKFSPRSVPFLKKVHGVTPLSACVFTLLLSAGVFLMLRVRRGQYAAVNYAVATTGFFGMLANLLLVFAFQTYYGYLYHQIGILISLFMAGSAAGSMYMTRLLRSGIDRRRMILVVEAGIIAFSLVLAAVIPRLAQASLAATLVFVALFFVCGSFIGLEFPLAASLRLSRKQGVGATAGTLYFADLAGGWFAGMLGGIACFAVLGVTGTCAVIVVLKAGSLLNLLAASGIPRARPSQD